MAGSHTRFKRQFRPAARIINAQQRRQNYGVGERRSRQKRGLEGSEAVWRAMPSGWHEGIN